MWRDTQKRKTSTYWAEKREYSWPCYGSMNTLWCEWSLNTVNTIKDKNIIIRPPSWTLTNHYNRVKELNNALFLPFTTLQIRNDRVENYVISRWNNWQLRCCVMYAENCIMGYYSIVVCFESFYKGIVMTLNFALFSSHYWRPDKNQTNCPEIK